MITRCYVASFCNPFLLKDIISRRIICKENIFLILKRKYIQNPQHNYTHNITSPSSLLGFAIACLTIWGVSKSIKARQDLLRWWDEVDSSSASYKNRPTNYKGPDVIGLRPSAQPYWTPGIFIPGAFAVAWPILYLATKS